ncbi:hypothetical protein [Streptomyces sp. NPDC008141]|uniref:hypothetical protein n=1 Tax=Streptomyces sp. NPDC008141 TaxID=3364815 RepID=UPI0036EEBDE5
MATFAGSAVQVIDVDGDEPILLHTLDTKAHNRIFLHSSKPFDTFIEYLRKSGALKLSNTCAGENIYLGYGRYHALRIHGTAEPKSALSATDQGWMQGTLNPTFEIPNLEHGKKRRIFNAGVKAATALLSPTNAAQMLIEKTILHKDFYVVLSGSEDPGGLKGEVTRIPLAHWSVKDGDYAEITLAEVADALEEHKDEIDKLHHHTLKDLREHLHKKHADHKDTTDTMFT